MIKVVCDEFDGSVLKVNNPVKYVNSKTLAPDYMIA